MDFRETLEAEPLIQSDDPRIQEEARRAVGALATRPEEGGGDSHDARGSYARQERDVLRTERSASSRLAAGRLQRAHRVVCGHGQGAWASGPYRGRPRLPRRVLLLSCVARGVLGEWVAVDPTFGQYPADAAHIRFVVGGLAQQVEIIRLIGRLDIEVLESTPTDGGRA